VNRVEDYTGILSGGTDNFMLKKKLYF